MIYKRMGKENLPKIMLGKNQLQTYLLAIKITANNIFQIYCKSRVA
jgi:hypothetical protein